MRSIRFAALAVLCLQAFAQTPGKLIGGPIVVNAGKDSATLVYVYESSVVKFGDAQNNLKRSAPILRSEKVALSKLKPGSVVHYDGAGGSGWFKTAPAEPQPFRFVVFGDTRSRHELHQKVANAIVGAEPDFVLHTGDLVADGLDPDHWATFFRIERELLRRTVFFPVLGNHERNSAQYFDFFDVKTPYYSFDWGNAHFIILDSNAGGPGIGAAARMNNQEEQKQWLEKDLAASAGAAFRFVILHHPPFTVNVEKKSHVSTFTPQLVPLFEKYKVTAVFGGHDHNYQRHVKDGVTYIVTGGGGAPLAKASAPLPDLTKKVVSTEHYVVVSVDGSQARLRAIALDGQEIESADLQ
jgi:acid phosphatase type 7